MAVLQYRIVALVTVFPLALDGIQVDRRPLKRSGIEDFDQFVAAYGRGYRRGSKEFEYRQAVFEQRKHDINIHNRRPGVTWTAGINPLSDKTDAELHGLRGYRHQVQKGGQGRPKSVQFLSQSVETMAMGDLPSNFSWLGRLKAMDDVQDQLSCGSCWAFAATTILRAHSELYQKDRRFSVQQILSCTPNPDECGGQGGCQGATAELALEYVTQVGCSDPDSWSYRGADESCPATMAVPSMSFFKGGSAPGLARTFGSGRGQGGLSFGLQGHKKLPENKLTVLKQALVKRGPIAVSVAADSHWNSYEHGIMEGCLPDSIINHAVTLVGYGVESGNKYWVLQNSWGHEWGERGFMRLARKDDEFEEAHCGWDTSPEIGSGCKGGPSKVWICGSCGILYDTVLPIFQGTMHATS